MAERNRTAFRAAPHRRRARSPSRSRWARPRRREAAEKAAEAVKAAAKGKPYMPKFFNPQEWKTVRVLVDMIIPKDERSGSATDAGVPEFMDYLMNDPTDTDLQRERRQTAMRGGLAWINSVCRAPLRPRLRGVPRRRSARRSSTRSPTARTSEEDEAEMREPRDLRVMVQHGPSFFNSFRDLTASGFWSQQDGDRGPAGTWATASWRSGRAPPPEVLAKLGLSDT